MVECSARTKGNYLTLEAVAIVRDAELYVSVPSDLPFAAAAPSVSVCTFSTKSRTVVRIGP